MDGKAGKGLAFRDYTGDFTKVDVTRGTVVTVPHHAALVPAKTVTLEADVYPTARPHYYGGLIEKGVGYGSAYRLLLLKDGRARGTVGNDHLAVTGKTPLTLDAWHHLTLTFDGETLTLTVDGTVEGTVTGAPGGFVNSDDLRFGYRFTGRLDNVSVTVQ